ncbi:hypothetical protein BX600DRAFT_554797 [Xylariales sp. PMI_506]|nr:hypothetical protein BX600DRAFT_554797 [Xylariales sp. PMI_506]
MVMDCPPDNPPTPNLAAHQHETSLVIASAAPAEIGATQQTKPPPTSPPPQPDSCYLITKLPLELRNAIYALLSDRVTYTPPHVRRDLGPDGAARFTIPAIARTCRQLRYEALSWHFGGGAGSSSSSNGSGRGHPSSAPGLRAQVWDDIELDAVFLERCLRDLGGASLLGLVRRLEVHHQVDFYLRTRYTDTAIVPVITRFAVVGDDDDRGGDGAGEVEVRCDFGTADNLGDEIPAGTVCTCTLADRMRRFKEKESAEEGSDQPSLSSPSSSSSPSSPRPPPHSAPKLALTSSIGPDADIPPHVLRNPLYRSVRTFLRLVATESFGHTPGRFYGRHARDDLDAARAAPEWWPRCETCGLRVWYLHGPPPPPQSILSPSKGGSAPRVVYHGYEWISCLSDQTDNSSAAAARRRQRQQQETPRPRPAWGFGGRTLEELMKEWGV